MYIPEHFRDLDPAAIGALLRDAPLACIVAQTFEGLVANHIPLFAAPDNRLIGHIARANTLHETVPDGAEVLVIFRGADAYISPNSYPSKAEHHRHVPTWNYSAVHVTGTITFQHDTPSKRAAVALLTRGHERRVNGARAWKMADAPADYMDQMLGAIVAFRIQPTRILAKAKLSQNRDARDLNGAIADLHARGADDVAQAMAARAHPPQD
jgi:transcriptional regulator